LENPPNSNCNPFSKQLGRPCEAWCADAIAAIAADVGLTLPNTSAYTPTMADGFRRAGRWTFLPQPGYIGFVDFPGDNTHGIQHVLIVKAIEDALHVRTLEGNTSSGEVGSQDNGGGYFERVRPIAWIVGYGMPEYADAPPVHAPGATQLSDEEAEMACVVERPQGGHIVVQHDGAVFGKGNPPAPYFGGVNAHPEWKLGGNIVGGAWTEDGGGYWLVGHDGAVYSFGNAEYYGGFNAEPPEARGSRYAIGMARTGPTSYVIETFDPSNDGSPYDGYDYAKK
jgi:hypothetical protein